MKCYLCTRWDRRSEPSTHTDMKWLGRGREFVAVLFAVRRKEKNKTTDENGHVEVYLFSDHLGLPVNLLPVGNITQEVMALCP